MNIYPTIGSSQQQRLHRRWIAWIALVVMLFTQFAVAAYACPALDPASAAMAMDTCAGMAAKAGQADSDNPNLCLHHCQQGSQHSDHAEVPPILPILGLISIVDWSDQSLLLPAAISVQAHELARSSSPPKSILHCCFRI